MSSASSSSTLSDEQRRRMEENRLKAIEKRNAAIARNNALLAQSQGQGSSAPRPAAVTITAPSISPLTLGINPSRTGSVQQQLQQNRTTTYSSTVNPSVVNQNATYRPQAPFPTVRSGNFPDKKPFAPFSSKQVVSGTCTMISRDRFLVDMGYQSEAIAIFKSIPGCTYETQRKKWSFPLSEHGKLLTAMECLRPNVTIGGLPPNILKVFRSSVPKRIPEVDSNVLSKIDPHLVHDLFDFQKEGICFGVSRGGRVLIADDMGLGKTIQALGIAHYYVQEWPLLIATPSSMKYSWRESIWRWLPSIPPGSVSVVESTADVEHALSAKVLIMSYDLLQKNCEYLQHCKVIIIDESHHLKNFKTARAKAATPLIQQAKRAILLSGTPALSRPIELYNQIVALSRTIFPNYNEYGMRYCNGKKNNWAWDFSGSSNMEELQLVLEETLMIRRMKSDVLQQLPAKRRQMLILDPTLVRVKSKGLQTTACAFIDGKHLKGMEARGKLLEYFSETGKAKLDAVASYVKDLVADGKKFLCFAHHQGVLDGICEVLESVQCKYIRIDGQVGAEERKKLCDHFQLKADVKVAVLSICAANSGITLTSAHLVVFAELFWNPGILTQAEDRAHRIGQEDSVLVQYLVAKGTADDVMWPMVANKLETLNKAGLSKDNFHEAGAEALIQASPSSSQQRSINDYFQPVATGTTTNEAEDADIAALFADDFFQDEGGFLKSNDEPVIPSPPKKTKF